jgi:hypothetical protein
MLESVGVVFVFALYGVCVAGGWERDDASRGRRLGD